MAKYEKWSRLQLPNGGPLYPNYGQEKVLMIASKGTMNDILNQFNGVIPQERLAYLTCLIEEEYRSRNITGNYSNFKHLSRIMHWGAELLKKISSSEPIPYDTMEKHLKTMGCTNKDIEKVFMFCSKMAVNSNLNQAYFHQKWSVDHDENSIVNNEDLTRTQQSLIHYMDLAQECEKEFGIEANTPTA